MNIQSTIRIAGLFFLLATGQTMAKDTLVGTQSEYEKAVAAAQPGDNIIMANGEWSDFEILFTGEGTADQPITLTAESKGQVVIGCVH